MPFKTSTRGGSPRVFSTCFHNVLATACAYIIRIKTSATAFDRKLLAMYTRHTSCRSITTQHYHLLKRKKVRLQCFTRQQAHTHREAHQYDTKKGPCSADGR